MNINTTNKSELKLLIILSFILGIIVSTLTHSIKIVNTTEYIGIVNKEKPTKISSLVDIIKPILIINSYTIKTTKQQEIDTMNLKNILVFEEGYRNKPYLCSEGFVTIGLGTKLNNKTGLNPEDFPIVFTMEIAEAFLNKDVVRMENSLNNSNMGDIFNTLDEDRRAIILSMSYQMGVSGVLKFPSMWKALKNKNWNEASKQALDSVWARVQTPARAGRHARVLAGETLDEVYNG